MVNGDLVYLNTSSVWMKVDTNFDVSTLFIGMVVGDIPGGSRGTIRLNGFIGDGSWSWVPSLPLFPTAVPGIISQTLSPLGSHQIIGWAITGNMIYFNP